MNSFLARQAVYDKNKNIIAYELLHREGKDNRYPVGISDEEATSKVILNTFLFSNLDIVSNGKPVLINFSEYMLKKRVPELLPPENIIIEILESANPMNIVKEIEYLFKKGYKFALDDFVYEKKWDRILKFISIVKIDILSLSLKDIIKTFSKIKEKNPKIKILAEKVENEEQMNSLLNIDFDYFQGYFFHTPEILKINNYNKNIETHFDEIDLMLLFLEKSKKISEF